MTEASMPRRALVRATDEDRYFDYCLQPYDPRRSPHGKLRSESLLWNSFDVAGAPSDLDDAMRAVQRASGRDMTVFGVKHHAGRLWWELYFYDPAKEDPGVRASAIIDAVAPWFDVSPRPRETIPYFMFSFDVMPDTTRRRVVDTTNVYLPYHVVQGGRSYKLTSDGRMEMDNVYRFYQPKPDIVEVVHEIKRSVFVDYSRVALSKVLLPELFTCNRICVAKKRLADAVYYSGIDVDQLIFFLRRFEYPEPIVRFVTEQRADLEPLRFDVGFDYVMRPDGSVSMGKSSYYGTF